MKTLVSGKFHMCAGAPARSLPIPKHGGRRHVTVYGRGEFQDPGTPASFLSTENSAECKKTKCHQASEWWELVVGRAFGGDLKHPMPTALASVPVNCWIDTSGLGCLQRVIFFISCNWCTLVLQNNGSHGYTFTSPSLTLSSTILFLFSHNSFRRLL